MKSYYAHKRILITGAAGTVGREIVKQLTLLGPVELRLMDNNETELFFLMEEYKKANVNCFLGDVRDAEKVEKLAKGIDIIIHCAAFKHVILSEYNPFDVVQTNIIGVENIMRAAQACNVGAVLFTSSDKAVNPTNVMGTSKLMGERLITAANAVKSAAHTVFTSTRFGNVIGSRGSVVPLFMKQIKQGGPITITDPQMTRFIMTIEESALMVLRSLTIARGGEVFVTKMPVVRILDLAEVMIELLAPRYGQLAADVRLTVIGAKPGEKLYEELMSDEEVHRSLELTDMFVVTPAFKSVYQDITYEYPGTLSNTLQKSYSSTTEVPLSKDAIKKYLVDNSVLENVENHLSGGLR